MFWKQSFFLLLLRLFVRLGLISEKYPFLDERFSIQQQVLYFIHATTLQAGDAVLSTNKNSRKRKDVEKYLP